MHLYAPPTLLILLPVTQGLPARAGQASPSFFVLLDRPLALGKNLFSSKGALVASMRAWHAFHEGWWQSRRGTCTVIVHCFSADATNKQVWLGSKLMSCELETMYIIDPRELLSKPVFECIESKKSWADALRVSDSTTIGTYNLLVKMLDGLGCPTWVDAPETTYDEESAVLEPSHDLAAADGQNSVRVFLYSSDGGPDEVRFKKTLTVLTMDHGHILFIPGTCFMHASQLWVRSGLFLVDAWARQYYSEEYRFKYFATLSKISHLWRENAVAIYRLFREEFDACTAVMFGSKIPSRCIAGRWQSCHATEKNILEVGPERLTTIQSAVFENQENRCQARRLAFTIRRI